MCHRQYVRSSTEIFSKTYAFFTRILNLLLIDIRLRDLDTGVHNYFNKTQQKTISDREFQKTARRTAHALFILRHHSKLHTFHHSHAVHITQDSYSVQNFRATNKRDIKISIVFQLVFLTIYSILLHYFRISWRWKTFHHFPDE